jgi:starch-binding outer membrane protein, SusD/RagB family
MNEFEPGDERRTDWVDSVIVDTTYYFPYKYKSANYGDPVSEYFMVLRLGEQYLIRAEAEANLNDITDAANDLNTIRLRAGLLPTTANTQSAMLQAILHERKVELFTEMGNRWLDLKRTNSVDSVMTIQTPIKANGSPWQSYQQLYPLPADQVLKDVNLVQNAGY